MELLNQFFELGITAYAILGFVALLLILFIILMVSKSIKKNKAKEVAPHFTFENLQVAPLGKGIHLKLKNTGAIAIIASAELAGRNDVEITQAFNDFKVDSNQTYSIYCETIGKGRADQGYEIQLSFQDQLGNLYQQKFPVENTNTSNTAPKLVKYA